MRADAEQLTGLMRQGLELPSAVNCAILAPLTLPPAMQRTILIRRITLAVLCAAPLAAQAEEGIRLKSQRSLLTLPAARNDPATIFMEADRIEGHAEKETEAEGNVRMRRLGQSVSADWMRYEAAGG